MEQQDRDSHPAPVIIGPPGWMRWFGPILLLGVWLAMMSVVVFAFRERDWMAPVRDSGLGVVGAIVGWVIVLFFLLILPPSIKVLLTYRSVLDVNGVEAPFGRGRFDLPEIETVRWVPQGGPVNAANRPERFEVLSEASGLIARVTRAEADWDAAVAMLRHWASIRPQVVRDESTAAVLGVELVSNAGHDRLD
ncbi:hypothetical protein N802_18125 [Knoellia sinensis KCTC 19936]|uniref:Uncharacterized protein n=2 Tax=Knoellia TaxID=136099 RepID=A0A0A0J9J0_9MICO|nr:hypothetical protein N802_18125 [Knoellia sinensis KCTC 19936]